MSSVSIAGDTSGSILLAAPAVAGSSTLTLPTTGGTVLANTTPGCVLQVVQGFYATDTSTTSMDPTFVNTGVQATITPTSASSKILVISTNGDASSTVPNGGAKYAIFRGATKLCAFSGNIPYQGTGGSFYICAGPSGSYLDSPATTSPVTYYTKFCGGGGVAGTFTANRDASTSTLILIEVAA